MTTTAAEHTRHKTHVEFDGRSYYAWCEDCFWHSPHRLVMAAVEEFTAGHERRTDRG